MVVLFLRRPTTVVAMLCWLLSAPPSRLFDGMVELETFPIMIFTYPQAPQCISNSSVGGTVYLQYYYGSINGRGIVLAAQWSRSRVERVESRERVEIGKRKIEREIERLRVARVVKSVVSRQYPQCHVISHLTS